MSEGVFLDPLKTPADFGFPGTPDEFLRFIAQFMAVKGLDNLMGIQVQEAKPSNTTLPWLAIDSTGKPLGTFKFFNSIWTSVEHEKGDFKYQNLTGSVHPHWKFADNTVNPGPINGVTIPTVTDRGFVAVTAGGKYSVGETGGADDKALVSANIPSHLHAKGTLGGSATSGSENRHRHNLEVGTSTTGSQVIDDNQSSGDQLINKLTNTNDAESEHTHSLSITGSTASTGDGTTFDNRSLYFGARLLIYVGVE